MEEATRLFLARSFKMPEDTPASVLEEKQSSIVAMSERVPKAGEVSIAATKLQELEQGAKLAKEMAESQHKKDRKASIDAAIAAIKIKASEREKWEVQYDRDPVGIAALLDGLEPGSAAGAEKGRTGDDAPSSIAGARGRRQQSETMREIFRLRGEVKKQAKDEGRRVPSDIDADLEVFSARPDLYAAYLRENSRTVAPSGEEA